MYYMIKGSVCYLEPIERAEFVDSVEVEDYFDRLGVGALVLA